jgi:hypothetical protein
MARDLKAAGANVWLDQLDIQPGQRWARALQDAITSAPRFVVILSPASVKSTNVEDEVSFALEERKTIIPVLYSDCNVPFQLRSFQYADFRHDYDRGLKILLQTMGVAAATPAAAASVEAKVSEERRKKAAEEGRREEEAKRTAESARQEEETRKATELAAAEKKRKEAQRQALPTQERKEAQERARQAQESIAAGEDDQPRRGLSLLAPVGRYTIGVATLIIAVVAYWMLFRGSNPPPPQPTQVSHAKVTDLKPTGRADQPPAKSGQVNGGAANGTSTSKSGIANGNPNGGTGGSAKRGLTALDPTGRAALLGEHRLSLQWLSWEKFGTATVVDKDGVLVLKGSQHVGDEYLTVEGTITSTEPKKFTMHGVIVTKIDSINKGQPCKRTGDMTFAITAARKYWRLQQMDNPCEAVTDYVDIYLR